MDDFPATNANFTVALVSRPLEGLLGLGLGNPVSEAKPHLIDLKHWHLLKRKQLRIWMALWGLVVVYGGFDGALASSFGLGNLVWMTFWLSMLTSRLLWFESFRGPFGAWFGERRCEEYRLQFFYDSIINDYLPFFTDIYDCGDDCLY